MAVGVDAYVPVIPLKLLNGIGNLGLTDEYVWGFGIADLYTSLNNGVADPALPNTMMANPAPTFTIDEDPSLVLFSADGKAHLIQIPVVHRRATVLPAAAQRRVSVSTNYMNVSSNNAKLYPNRMFARLSEARGDANLFAVVTLAIRLGFVYIYSLDHYSDGLMP